jgi:hypothetical protein
MGLQDAFGSEEHSRATVSFVDHRDIGWSQQHRGHFMSHMHRKLL